MHACSTDSTAEMRIALELQVRGWVYGGMGGVGNTTIALLALVALLALSRTPRTKGIVK